jgi:hypothetical protein
VSCSNVGNKCLEGGSLIYIVQNLELSFVILTNNNIIVKVHLRF